MQKFNLRKVLPLLLPALILIPGCEKGKDTKKKKTQKRAQIEARSAMPECQGQVDACVKQDEACKDGDEACGDKLFDCLGAIPENCFPPLPDNMEDTPEGWVDVFEVCFKDPKLDACFKTYDGCVEAGTDEKTCFAQLEKCVNPLVSNECKELDKEDAAQPKEDEQEQEQEQDEQDEQDQ